MLRKKAVAKFIDACYEKGWNKAIILDQIYRFATNTVDGTRMQEVEILEEGEVVHPS